MKVCTTCKLEKSFEEFRKNKLTKDGYKSQCKLCVSITDKLYREAHNNDILKKQKEWRKLNKDKKTSSNKKWSENNKEHIKEKAKLYRENSLPRTEYYKEWYQNNINTIKDRTKLYKCNKRKTDYLFNAKDKIGNLIRSSLKKKGFKKQSRTCEILGCDYEFFIQYIADKFLDGMSWNNHGEWHLDHIYPISKAIDENHMILLNHYTNFQPMWKLDNIKKGNKVNSFYKNNIL